MTSSRLPRGDNPPAAAMTSRGVGNSSGLDLNDELCACRCRVVSMVYGSPWPFSFLLPPEVAVAAGPEVGCFLTLNRREGCRSSFGEDRPEGPRSERLDLFDFDDPCL